MIEWAHRLLIVPNTNKATAVALCLQLAEPPAADGMFSTGLSATGASPATHWISSGLIDAQFAALLGNASATHAAYQAAGGTTVTLAEITALYAAATVRADAQDTEHAVLAELGLKLVRN